MICVRVYLATETDIKFQRRIGLTLLQQSYKCAVEIISSDVEQLSDRSLQSICHIHDTTMLDR